MSHYLELIHVFKVKKKIIIFIYLANVRDMQSPYKGKKKKKSRLCIFY